MKRLAVVVAFALVVCWLYPLEGIWWPGQILRASVDGRPLRRTLPFRHCETGQVCRETGQVRR